MVKETGNKTQISLYIDPKTLAKVDNTRGLIKRNTFLENIIREAVKA